MSAAILAGGIVAAGPLEQLWNRHRLPLVFTYDRIRWVYRGNRYAGVRTTMPIGSPILEAQCPRRRVRAQYLNNETGQISDLWVDDVVRQGSHYRDGVLWCVGGRKHGHTLDVTWSEMRFRDFLLRAQAELKKRIGEE
ncbi:MAG: hypothetical protein IIC73_07030 [Armatimonadetes bacterium]|nr:hypothetical protein [Armatimonadota bacterium]